MREYLVTLLISAALCYLITPIVRTQALRFGAVAKIRERDIHSTPTARWGGIAMWASMALTFLIVSNLPLVGKSVGREAQGVLLEARKKHPNPERWVIACSTQLFQGWMRKRRN